MKYPLGSGGVWSRAPMTQEDAQTETEKVVLAPFDQAPGGETFAGWAVGCLAGERREESSGTGEGT